MNNNKIAQQQATFYGNLFDEFGHSVDAVASGALQYKLMRYDRLTRIIGTETAFSIHDVGFGLGHLREYLIENFDDRQVAWSGSEVTPSFCDHLRRSDPDVTVLLRDLSTSPGEERYDYVILAGTFYHLAGSHPEEFLEFVRAMVGNCWKMCTKGLAFNVMTDAVEYRKDDLFYPDIADMIGLSRSLTRHFEIDHATPLYEYTVRLYRPEYLAQLYSSEHFRKYFRDVKPLFHEA
jgi:hypothetical protein